MKRESKHPDIGMKLRAIREHLGFTINELCKKTNISPSYLSDFERGIKLPTSKYLKYLFDNHNVNLNYVFCSEGRMFRPSSEELAIRNFGKFQEEVEEILDCIMKSPHALYSMLIYFTEYKEKNRESIAAIQKEKHSEVRVEGTIG